MFQQSKVSLDIMLNAFIGVKKNKLQGHFKNECTGQYLLHSKGE